ncbi:MAG: dihydroorotate dehydrogenase electron transfer subunit [Firmicutes bacterium]|nr:dihydroorotate dehydrogenase electron transfer subunit [Bacillota bacterium]
MKQGIFTITENRKIAKDIYIMSMEGDTSAFTRPGQFANLEVKGFYLRRPISVYDWEDGKLVMIYKVVGEGTQAMSEMEVGEQMDLLTGLGNGFDTAKSGDTPLLVGGGVGVPPLYALAKKLIAEGKTVKAILGFASAEDVFCEEEFKALGVETVIVTADGSYGKKGFVTDALKDVEPYTYFYTCGPKAMLQALCEQCTTSGELSLEERMGCGFGACMGCTCETTKGEKKRICKEGPVLEKEEIVW